MKTILLTGGTGFIGSSIKNRLQSDYNLLTPTRDDLNLENKKEVAEFIDQNKPSVMIHAAAKGAFDRTSPDVYETNMRIFDSLQDYIPSVERFINFDSGAIFGAWQSINAESIYTLKDLELHDDYSLSKLEIAHRILTYPNAINLRLYGCFGPGESPQRFVSTCLFNASHGKDTIVKDMYFDYFYVMDILPVLDYCINNPAYTDMDLVYESSGSIKLSSIAREIYKLVHPKIGRVIVDDSKMPFYYCGDYGKLGSLNLKLNGLTNGIIDTAAHYFC